VPAVEVIELPQKSLNGPREHLAELASESVEF
jgi:hypothetical protein